MTETLHLSKLLLILITFAFAFFILINDAFQLLPLQFAVMTLLFIVLAIEEWRFKGNITNAVTIGAGIVFVLAFGIMKGFL